MNRHALLLCSLLLVLTAAQAPEAPKPGELGYQPPEVLDVIVPDTVAHNETTGGALQTLLALGGAPGGGFSAVWRDTRDGTLGLYFTRLDSEGRPREGERSICLPHTIRRTDAVAALAPDGHGTIAWTAVLGRGAVPFVRCFDAAGVILGGERMLSPILEIPEKDLARAGRGGDEAASCREPALAALDGGRTAILWTRAGRIQWLELTRDGDPEAPVADLDPTLPLAENGLRVATGPAGTVACLWRSKDGALHVSLCREKRAVTTDVGRGVPRSIAADANGGYWILATDDGRSRVQHLGADGKPDREPCAIEDGRDPKAELAAFDGGVALLERVTNAGAESGPPRVWLLDATGAILPGSPLTITSAAAAGVSDPRIASSGSKLLVAWTDYREGDGNVYARRIDTAAPAENRLSDERRLNTDTASANQGHPAVASKGEHGVMTWVDERRTASPIYIRRFGANGFTGPELMVPVATESTPAPPIYGGQHPAVAVRANGDALVCWRAVYGEKGQALYGQIVALDGRAVSPLLFIDDGGGQALLDIACTALSDQGGFALAWPRGGPGSIHVRRVAPDGTLGELQTVSAAPPAGAGVRSCADVDIVELESGRLLCAWTLHRPPAPCSIRGRFLTESLTPIGTELEFEDTQRNGDWDPSLAAANGGGFVMSWTSGPVSDLVRDVVVRAFDGRARPSAPHHRASFMANEQDFSDVARMADKSFVIAWEDDSSYFDQVYMRRLSRDGRELGPIMRINALETAFLMDRVLPRVAPMGGGLAAVFADRHRSLGFDVLFKLVGPGFDAVDKR